MFRRKCIGHCVVRDDITKNILAIINKQSLLLFIIRLFSNTDSQNLLDMEIQKLKIARPLESIKFLYELDSMYKGILMFKSNQVDVTSCHFCQWLKR